MKKNIASRIAAALGALLLMGAVASVANSFLGNPVSAYFATKSNEKYAQEKYPNLNLRVGKARYNFKFSEYYSNAVSTIEPDTHFNIIYRKNKTVYDYYESSVLSGFNTEKRFGEERTKEIKPLLTAKYGNALSGRCFVEFDVEKFQTLFKSGVIKVNQPYNKEFQCSMGLYADFKIDSATADNIARQIIELNSFLTGQGYAIDKFIGDYWDDTKQGYSIALDREMINDNLASVIQKAINDRNSVPWEKISVYPYRR